MPASKTPMGSVPDSSQPAVEAKADIEDVIPVVEEVSEPDIDESDVKELEETQKVPYSRFKDKVDESKRLKEELDQTHRKHQDDIQRLIQEREALKAQPKYEESEILDVDDEATKQIRELRKIVEKQSKDLENLTYRSREADLSAQLASLKKTYPDLDDLEVLGWKKTKPQEDLATLAELSHNKLNKRVSQKIQTMLESKKAKAKNAVPLKTTIEKMKASEKPKTVKEASSLLRRLIGN